MSTYFFIALVYFLLFAIPLWAYWSQLEFGQRVFACGFAVLFPMTFIFVPFRNPNDDSLRWWFAWDPPVYVIESPDLTIPPERLAEIETETGISISAEALSGQFTKEMPRAWGRFRFLRLRTDQVVLLLLGIAGWWSIPVLIDHVAFYNARMKKRE